MAKPTAPREDARPMSNASADKAASKIEDQVKRESAAQYRSSIDKINRSQDRDIERALSR
ncbi:hypothetical protein ABIA85_008864 [Bradyrhizobium sp. LA6.10]